MHQAAVILEDAARVAVAFAIAFYVSKPIAWLIVPPRKEE